MALFLNDTFTDTNGTGLSSHTADSGATWSLVTGETNPELKINSNRVAGQDGNGHVAMYAVATPASADYEVEAVARFNANGNSFADTLSDAIFARLSSAAVAGYAFGLISNSGGSGRRWQLARFFGSPTFLASDTTNLPSTAGDIRTLRIAVSGTGATVNVKCYVDNTLVINFDDTSGSRVTPTNQAGLYSVPFANHSLEWDSITGGPITTRVTPTGQSATASGGTLTPTVAVTLTGQSATVTPGIITAGLLVGQQATATPGTIKPAVAVTLTGQSATAAGGTLSIARGAALTGQAVTASGGTLAPKVAAGATTTTTVAPTATTESYNAGGQTFFPGNFNNTFMSLKGVLVGTREKNFVTSVGGIAPTSTRTQENQQSQITKPVPYAWTSFGTSTTDLDPSFGGSAFQTFPNSSNTYDWAPNYGLGGMYSVDPDGGFHWVHERALGFATPTNVTAYATYQNEQMGSATLYWGHEYKRTAVDASTDYHSASMGIYGVTPSTGLLFYPSLSGSDWVPTLVRWNGTAWSSPTQLTGFTGAANCYALHRSLCVVPSGYGDTIYAVYLSAANATSKTPAYVGVIVMNAVTLVVTSHTLTAVTTQASPYASGTQPQIGSMPIPPFRPVAEVVKLSSGTSVTQFVLGGSVVNLSWTSAGITTPTVTLKAGPTAGTGHDLVPGWESLEIRADNVVHVLYDRAYSSNGTIATSNFRLYTNDATGVGASWALSSSDVFSWTERVDGVGSINNAYLSGFGGGLDTWLFNSACYFNTTPQARNTAQAWLSYWAGQAPYLSVSAKARVGRVGITITNGVTLVLTGLSASTAQGSIKPAISKAITGQSATVGSGSITASVNGAVTVGLTGLQAVAFPGVLGAMPSLIGQQAAAAVGTFVPEIAVTLTGQSCTAQRGLPAPTNAPRLSVPTLVATGGSLTPLVGIPLTGGFCTASSGLAQPGFTVTLASPALAAASGTLGPSLTLALRSGALAARAGNTVPALSARLAGGSIGSVQGLLGVSIDRAFTGQSASAFAGIVGQRHDCNLFPRGLAARAAIGVVTTNIPPLPDRFHVWVTAHDLHLTSTVLPTEFAVDSD
jgi:hypothetical protein